MRKGGFCEDAGVQQSWKCEVDAPSGIKSVGIGSTARSDRGNSQDTVVVTEKEISSSDQVQWYNTRSKRPASVHEEEQKKEKARKTIDESLPYPSRASKLESRILFMKRHSELKGNMDQRRAPSTRKRRRARPGRRTEFGAGIRDVAVLKEDGRGEFSDVRRRMVYCMPTYGCRTCQVDRKAHGETTSPLEVIVGRLNGSTDGACYSVNVDSRTLSIGLDSPTLFHVWQG